MRFFFFNFIFGAALVAYGSSQAKDWIRATAAGLHPSHSNAGSKPCLQPTPQLTAMPHPEPSEQPCLLMDPVGLVKHWATKGTPSHIALVSRKQCAVRAATEGRTLVLEGLEKAERNVLPVLNNLLENREMQLEDGRFLMSAERYDKLLQVRKEKCGRFVCAVGLWAVPFVV